LGGSIDASAFRGSMGYRMFARIAAFARLANGQWNPGRNICLVGALAVG
jgi:hypothetical protein